MSSDVDKVFAGSIPRLYEDYFVPLIFAPYAIDLAGRVAARKAARVLEIAAGTGVVTREASTAITPKLISQPDLPLSGTRREKNAFRSDSGVRLNINASASRRLASACPCRAVSQW